MKEPRVHRRAALSWFSLLKDRSGMELPTVIAAVTIGIAPISAVAAIAATSIIIVVVVAGVIITTTTVVTITA